MDSTALRHCSRCEQDRPRSQFARNASKPDGLATWCKWCQNDYQNDRYAVDPVYRRERNERDVAWRSAMRRLKANHEDEFAVLFAEELARFGYVPRQGTVT